ncbi:MAG: hypothetical protein Ct9H90mP2_01630 [Dehalococcoidia bacterium]|nr:MAG: hypothetical protein Ct9H90mP2_01630 [Dehalococcoidia bacterium]
MSLYHLSGKKLIGDKLYEQLEEISIDLYIKAHDFCENKGIILADTKILIWNN